MGMTLAKVVAVHPESHTVDLLEMADGRRMPGIKVMSGSASSDSGVAGLARPSSQDAADPYSVPFNAERDIIACVGFYNDLPVVMGFLFPKVSQCLFPDVDRVINRTPSDAYWTTDKDGNTEFFHPSGTYIRVAVTPEHEDLTGKDFAGQWKIKRNTDKAVHVHMEVQVAGVKKVLFDMAPEGTALLEASTSATVKAPHIVLDAPTTTITGHLDVGNGITSVGDVTADDISLKHHLTSGVLPGGGESGQPVSG